MAPIAPRAFAGLLAGLSAERFAAFVADLWRRRGWDARVEGDVVVLDDGAGTTRRLLVSHDAGRLRRALRRLGAGSVVGADAAEADADAVVTSARDPPASADAPEVVDAEDLRLAALYAVDADDREALFDAHFGRSPAGDPPARRDAPVSAATAGLLAVVGVVLVGLVAGAPGAFGGAGTAPAPEPGAAADPTASPPAPATATATATQSGGRGPAYPLGLGPDGVTDADALARTHAFLLAGSSYRWTITYREVVDGETRGWVRERVAVENATVYRSTVDRGGTVTSGTLLVSRASTYADGSVRYERREANGTVRYRRSDLGAGGPPFSDHPRRLIAWYLSVRESETVAPGPDRDTGLFQVYGEGDDWPRTTNVTTAAIVDREGLVWTLQRAHSPPDSDVRIVVTYSLEEVGNVTVTPPPWAGAARRATA